MSKYLLFILSFCFEFVNSNLLKSNKYNNQKQVDFTSNNTYSDSLYRMERETADNIIYIIFIILQCILILINIVCISIRIFNICCHHYVKDSENKEILRTKFKEEKNENELLLINTEDNTGNKNNKINFEEELKEKSDNKSKLKKIDTLEINDAQYKKSENIITECNDILSCGMWTNVGAVSYFYLFSFTFIFPYRGNLMIPCIVFFCLSIYLSLVHLNISLLQNL